MKNKTRKKIKLTKNVNNVKKFPDLTKFRKSITYKGESLTAIVIKGRD